MMDNHSVISFPIKYQLIIMEIISVVEHWYMRNGYWVQHIAWNSRYFINEIYLINTLGIVLHRFKISMLLWVLPIWIKRIQSMYKSHVFQHTFHIHVMMLGNIQLKMIVWILALLVIFRGNPKDGNITRNDHDLVLLKLQTHAQLTDRVKPIRLPYSLTDNITPDNIKQCVVSGFGTIKDTRQSHILKYLTVPLVSREQWYSSNLSFIFSFSYF